MQERLHKFQTAIIWRDEYKVGRGSGLLISQNLVLTCAHNFYDDMLAVDTDLSWQFLATLNKTTRLQTNGESNLK